MRKLIDWLIRRTSVQKRLLEQGWQAPPDPVSPKKAKAKSGPGPWRPPK
jgi:hypothetical protein